MLDYAVSTMDTRSAELEHLFQAGANAGNLVRKTMQQAVKAELEEGISRPGASTTRKRYPIP